MKVRRDSVRIGLKEYVTPMLSVPQSPLSRSRMRCSHSSASRRVRLAYGNSSSPASVSATLWLVRFRSCVSSESSSCLICWDRVLWVMKSDLAASEKLSVSATFTKYRSCRSSIGHRVAVNALFLKMKMGMVAHITIARIIERVMNPFCANW